MYLYSKYSYMQTNPSHILVFGYVHCRVSYTYMFAGRKQNPRRRISLDLHDPQLYIWMMKLANFFFIIENSKSFSSSGNGKKKHWPNARLFAFLYFYFRMSLLLLICIYHTHNRRIVPMQVTFCFIFLRLFIDEENKSFMGCESRI